MKLVFVYGPPAAGKLTVATALAEITGFKLFHNHLSVDLVASLFPFGSPPFQELVGRFRLELLERAAEARVPGVIFTFVYASPVDDAFVRRVCSVVEKHGAEVCFVQLACDRATLATRVIEGSRKGHGKLTDPEELAKVLERYDCASPVPDRPSLTIDSACVPASEAAQAIARRFGLDWEG